MVSAIVASSSSSSSWPLRHALFFHPYCHNNNLFSSKPSSSKQVSALRPNLSTTHIRLRSSQTLHLFISSRKSKTKLQAHQRDFGPDWPILRRWEVPWQWQTFSLTSIACALSLVLTVWLEVNALQSLEAEGDELSSDEEAVIFLVNHGFATAIVLQVLYGITNMYQPLPQDFFKYDWREPFNLQKGWLLWGGVGLAGALIAIALPGAAMSFFNEESQETSTRKTDTLVRLLPVGSSYVRTACVLASTGLLAPLLEETVFRGFVMASLTKWVPTPVAVLISAAVFSLCHFTPGVFPWLFVLVVKCFSCCLFVNSFSDTYQIIVAELDGNIFPPLVKSKSCTDPFH